MHYYFINQCKTELPCEHYNGLLLFVTEWVHYNVLLLFVTDWLVQYKEVHIWPKQSCSSRTIFIRSIFRATPWTKTQETNYFLKLQLKNILNKIRYVAYQRNIFLTLEPIYSLKLNGALNFWAINLLFQSWNVLTSKPLPWRCGSYAEMRWDMPYVVHEFDF